MKKHVVICAAVLLIALCAAPSFATTYNVGPGQTYTNIRDVPWESLAAGDTVNIYYRSNAYQEKFNVTAGGTSGNPVLIHGVPDGSGNLPVIDGNNAITRTQQTYASDERAVINVGRDNNHGSGFQTSYVTIENLEIKNGTSPNTYMSDDGTQKTYASGANGMYVIMADHVTLRNLVIHNNGEGYFFSSSDGYGTTSVMLVEGCYVYNNGVSGSDQVHGSYCESLGLTYQYNHYGPLLSGCNGAQIKDRSAATVVRYNWLEAGFWCIDLVDPEDSTTIFNDPSYGRAWVYGNILVKTDGSRMVHWGGDGTPARYRDLSLEFYNNTFVSRSTGDTVRLFQGSSGAIVGPVNAYNNIFYKAGGTLYIAYNYGTVNISHNWIQSGFLNADGSCTVNNDGTNIGGTAPGFVDYTNQDYHIANGSACINAGQALPAVDLPANNVTMQYVKHLSGESRPTNGALDIGAYEYGSGSALSITTSSLPADTVNIAYNQTLSATGGTTPYTWSLQSGSLPAGLSLVASTGAITGTPTASGTSSFTAKVTDNVAATATKALSIVVNAAVSITTASLPADTVNVAYNQTLAATGGTGALTWSLQSGSLPAGLSLVSGTGAITGTPTASGTSSFTAKATDTVGASGTKALSIVVNAAVSITTASLPADTINVAYNQTMAATGGTGALTWSLSSGSLPAGLSLTAGTGAITGTPTASGTSSFTARATDTLGASGTKALSIVINAAPSITTSSLPADTINIAYNQTLAASGGTSPLTWSIQSGSLPAGLSLVSGTGAITGTPTASGTSSFTAKVADNVGASASKALSIVINAAPSITTSSLPAGSVGVAYNQTMTSTGGTSPLTWSLASGSLPGGLSLTASTGAITGTPTAGGTSNFTARVTDNVGATATKALSIVISANLTITTSSLPATTMGVLYNQTLTASGGTTPYTWSIQAGSLPAGLSLTAGTGAITGTPTASGTSSFTAKVTDNVAATATKALSIVVNAAPSITTTSLPAGTVNTAYSQTLAATGGTTPLAWSIQSGTLPAGLSLVASTGAITGTPTTSGTSNFTAKVQDNVGASATKALSIVINAGGGTSATYQFVASDTETNTTSTNWVNKATMTFTPNASDDWMIFAFAEFKESSTSYRNQIQVTIDGAVAQASDVAPKDTTDYQSFSGLKVVTLSAASHTFNIDYRTSNASGTAYVRRVRIVAVRKSALELYSADGGDAGSDLTTTETTYASVAFTPSATADYEFIWSAEWTANTTSYNTVVIGGFNNGTAYSSDISTVTANDTNNYYTFLGNKTVNLASGVQVTAQVRAYKQSGSSGTHHIRRAHLAVFNITTGRFANNQMVRDDNETTTTSTTFQQKTTKSISISTAADWLVIDTFRLANSSTSYSTEGQVQLDNSTTEANPMRRPQATTDYIQCSCIDVRNLATGTRVFDQDYRTTNASGTAKCKNGHFIALPL